MQLGAQPARLRRSLLPRLPQGRLRATSPCLQQLADELWHAVLHRTRATSGEVLRRRAFGRMLQPRARHAATAWALDRKRNRRPAPLLVAGLPGRADSGPAQSRRAPAAASPRSDRHRWTWPAASAIRWRRSRRRCGDDGQPGRDSGGDRSGTSVSYSVGLISATGARSTAGRGRLSGDGGTGCQRTRL
jgi:hypothetical protein